MTSALFQLLVSMSGVVSSFELPRYPPVADTTITHSVMLALRDNKISSDNKAQISSDNQRSRGQFLQKHQDFLFPCPFVCQSDEAVSQPSSSNQDWNCFLYWEIYSILVCGPARSDYSSCPTSNHWLGHLLHLLGHTRLNQSRGALTRTNKPTIKWNKTLKTILICQTNLSHEIAFNTLRVINDLFW